MDTFVNAIVVHAEAIQVEMNAVRARLRCMPHTIHLAALKVWNHYHVLYLTLTHAILPSSCLRLLVQNGALLTRKQTLQVTITKIPLAYHSVKKPTMMQQLRKVVMRLIRALKTCRAPLNLFYWQ
jgi:hypothetical protein